MGGTYLKPHVVAIGYVTCVIPMHVTVSATFNILYKLGSNF